MFWKYLLAALAGAGAVWLWQARRRLGLRLSRIERTPAAWGGEEFETVVDELVSAAEQLMEDLNQRQQEMQFLLQEADERIASLRQASGAAAPEAIEPAPVALAPVPEAPAATAPSEETVQAAAAMVAAARLGQAAWTAGAGLGGLRAGGSAPAAAAAASLAKPRAATKKSGSGKSSRSTKATGARTKARSGGDGATRSTAKKAASRVAGSLAAEPVAVKTESRHQDVLNLAERGLGPAEIARLTGRTTGEVQLILGLNRNLH